MVELQVTKAPNGGDIQAPRLSFFQVIGGIADPGSSAFTIVATDWYALIDLPGPARFDSKVLWTKIVVEFFWDRDRRPDLAVPRRRSTR